MSYQPEPPQKIQIKMKGSAFEVHWDFRSAPDTLTIRTECERLDGYIDGFMDGVLATLEIPLKDIYLMGCSKGAIKELDQQLAIKLASILAKLFLPLVTLEQEKLRTHSQQLHHSGRFVDSDVNGGLARVGA